MSDFWGLSDGSSAIGTKEGFETGGGGSFDPIPHESTVLCTIDKAHWEKDTNGNKHINVQWSVVKPKEFENRKVFQKLWVTDDNPNKKTQEQIDKRRNDDKRHLGRIDEESGGKLSKRSVTPTDDELAFALQGKLMTIKVNIFEGDRGPRNYVCAVMSKSKPVEITSAAPPKAQAAKVQTSQGFADFDDDSDVPF